MSVRAVRLLLILIALGVAGCDQGTKRWAETDLAGERSVDVAPGFQLTYTENPGNAFRMDRVLPAPARAPILWGAAIVTLAVIALAWWRQRRFDATAIAGALVAGGAAGNLIDRAVRGHVVDFLHVRGWPVFNVADIALAAGAILLIAAAWVPRLRRREP